MKRVHKFWVVVTLAVVIFVMTAGTALAFTTYNDHVLNGGVGNYGSNPRYFYITSSASSQSGDITGAVWDWNHTTERVGCTTPAYWVRTYTQSSSVMDFYYGYYYDPGLQIIAITEPMLNNVVTNPFWNNWNWAKIKLNNVLYDPLSDFNEKGVCAHEMGHVMALGHTTGSVYRIMCTLADGRLVSGAQPDDCYGINYLY